MKKFLLLFSVLLAGLTANAATINAADLSGIGDGVSLNVQGFTFTAAKNSGSNAPTYNANGGDVRLYAKATLTVAGKKLTKLVFNISTNGHKRLTDVTASAGTVVVDSTAWTVTWTGDAESVVLTVGDKATYGTDGDTKAGQLCFASVDVEGEAGEATNPGETEEPKGEITVYNFKKVNAVTSGKEYLLVAGTKAAAIITSNYGYIRVTDVTDADGVITVKEKTNALTIEATEGGYTLKQSDGRYIYLTGTYNSFNVAAEPAEAQVWTIEAQQDGTFKITNAEKQKYIQYDAQYTSYGCYDDTNDQRSLPCLYEFAGTSTQQQEDEPKEEPVEVKKGENILANGDFETWTNGLPDNWKSASSASSATLTQSEDAHGGSYAVTVGSASGTNKRLAYKELLLPRGNYTMSFYAKGGQVRPGYVPMKEDGSAGSYTYGDYATLSTTEWTLVTHVFELAAPTKVCLVVMNPKSNEGQGYEATDAVIDDFSLVWDEYTGISSATMTVAPAAIFDLQGRRAQSLKSGLYIVGGKKMLVK